MAVFPTKFLLATDGSGEADYAAQTAVELADSTGSELHVVYVDEAPAVAGAYTQGVPVGRSEEHREVLEEQVKRVEQSGGRIAQVHVRHGRPVGEIIELSEEIGAGLIVLGSKGYGELERFVMGSVSEGVARYASCPVLVVRRPSAKP